MTFRIFSPRYKRIFVKIFNKFYENIGRTLEVFRENVEVEFEVIIKNFQKNIQKTLYKLC